MSAAKRPSVAVRLPAMSESMASCVEALHALDGVEVCRLEQVASVQHLDLILDLTTQPPQPDHIPAPRFGYWTFLYGETPERIAPGLTEILSGRRAAFVRLARLLPGGRAQILVRCGAWPATPWLGNDSAAWAEREPSGCSIGRCRPPG